MKPNFLVIGAMKCGTTQLCHLLSLHPDVFISDPKEPDFFGKDHIYNQGWDWYESLFAASEGKKAIGEGSANYSKQLLFPNSAPRIAKHLPDAKLIYITRDPIARIESQWIDSYLYLNESPDFNKAICKNPKYIETSKYWKQICVYREYFPDERILVLFFKDFVANQEATVRKCYDFLGVEPSVQLQISMQNQNKSVGKVGPGLLKRLVRQVKPLSAISKALPKSVKKPLATMLGKRVNAKPTWDREVRQWALEQLASDTQQFLQFYGKPADWW